MSGATTLYRRSGKSSGTACIALAVLLGITGLLPASVYADNWQGSLPDTGLPAHVVAVDKARQLFFLYAKAPPLTLKFRYPCTTGQKVGDKQVINDLRTPEGIYFVDYKIASGLDFREYGGIAYTLNYPNPVDKLRGKTGHGIWIHSKGFGIVPRDTRGCIAIGLQEIDEAGPLLTPGTPVVVAEHFPSEQMPAGDGATATLLKRRMNQWAQAWASRSPELFEFYDADAYSRAMSESFADFRASKERMFENFSWITILNREIHALEGPGYWVTWSEQLYRAPNLSTEGIRRLYWQKDSGGQFRIVGMEWLPSNLGMEAAYLKGQLVASAENTTSDAVASEAPAPPPISLPENTGEKRQAADATPDVTVNLPPPPLPEAPVVLPPRPQQDPDMEAPTAQTQTPAPLTLDAALTTRLRQNMQAWCRAWEQTSPELFDFYDKNNYGNVKGLPAAAKTPFKDFQADTQRLFRAAWLEGLHGVVSVSVAGSFFVTSAPQWWLGAHIPAQQGLRTLYWQPDASGALRVVGGAWHPGEYGLHAAYLEEIIIPIARMIEEWRQAWERGDVDAYMRYYTTDARQQGRGIEHIRQQKTSLWGRSAPGTVRLTGLRVQIDPTGIRADMGQYYTSRTGRSDKGIKTLLLRPVNGEWRISKEDWAPEPQTAGNP